MAITVALIGTLATSTGIVGASLILLGVLSLPIMIKQGYSKNSQLEQLPHPTVLGSLYHHQLCWFMADQQSSSW